MRSARPLGPTPRRSLPRLTLVLASSAWLAAGCTDSVKVSEQHAGEHADALAKLATKDVEEIRRGLPEGAKKLAGFLFEEGREVTPARARKALKKTREAVVDLQLAKSTFFAVTDPNGVAHANDQETDAMSGKNLLTAFPPLAEAKTKYVEATGSTDEARGVKAGEDLQWVAGAPILEGGELRGIYVTGWSFRRFAHHLEEQFKSDWRQERSKTGKNERMPLLYVFVVKGPKAYGAPVTPEVSQKAVEQLGVVPKLPAQGVWRGRVEITDRWYGVGAAAAKALCDDCAVVVLRSEV